MNDSGCDNNADVLSAPPATGRLPSFFSFYSFFRSSGSSVKEGSDLRNRSLDSRRLAVPDIDYTALRYRSTDYHPQRNKEIRMSESEDPMRPPGLNNSVKSLQ
jgi:hypothetical protein